jgi:hypothetical protein
MTVDLVGQVGRVGQVGNPHDPPSLTVIPASFGVAGPRDLRDRGIPS